MKQQKHSSIHKKPADKCLYHHHSSPSSSDQTLITPQKVQQLEPNVCLIKLTKVQPPVATPTQHLKSSTQNQPTPNQRQLTTVTINLTTPTPNRNLVTPTIDISRCQDTRITPYPKSAKSPKVDAKSVIDKWRASDWQRHSTASQNGVEAYLAFKSLAFKKYRYNIYLLQRAALRIQHWFFKSKATIQRREQLNQWSTTTSQQSHHQRVVKPEQMPMPMTMQEKERESLRKLVQQRVGSPEKASNENEVRFTIRSGSRNRGGGRVFEERGNHQEEEIKEALQDVVENRKKAVNITTLYLDGSISTINPQQSIDHVNSKHQSVRQSKSTSLLNKVNRQAQAFEEQSFYKNHSTSILSQVNDQPTNLLKPAHNAATTEHEFTQSSILEISQATVDHQLLDHNRHLHNTTCSENSQFLKKKLYKPSKEASIALNIREGENRALKVFEGFQREREYMSKRSKTGSVDHSFSASPVKAQQAVNSQPPPQSQNHNQLIILEKEIIIDTLEEIKETPNFENKNQQHKQKDIIKDPKSILDRLRKHKSNAQKPTVLEEQEPFQRQSLSQTKLTPRHQRSDTITNANQLFKFNAKDHNSSPVERKHKSRKGTPEQLNNQEPSFQEEIKVTVNNNQNQIKDGPNEEIINNGLTEELELKSSSSVRQNRVIKPTKEENSVKPVLHQQRQDSRQSLFDKSSSFEELFNHQNRKSEILTPSLQSSELEFRKSGNPIHYQLEVKPPLPRTLSITNKKESQQVQKSDSNNKRNSFTLINQNNYARESLLNRGLSNLQSRQPFEISPLQSNPSFVRDNDVPFYIEETTIPSPIARSPVPHLFFKAPSLRESIASQMADHPFTDNTRPQKKTSIASCLQEYMNKKLAMQVQGGTTVDHTIYTSRTMTLNPGTSRTAATVKQISTQRTFQRQQENHFQPSSDSFSIQHGDSLHNQLKASFTSKLTMNNQRWFQTDMKSSQYSQSPSRNSISPVHYRAPTAVLPKSKLIVGSNQAHNKNTTNDVSKPKQQTTELPRFQVPQPYMKPAKLIELSEPVFKHAPKSPTSITRHLKQNSTPTEKSAVFQLLKKAKSYERLEPVKKMINNANSIDFDSSMIHSQQYMQYTQCQNNKLSQNQSTTLSQYTPFSHIKEGTSNKTVLIKNNSQKSLTYEEYKVLLYHQQIKNQIKKPTHQSYNKSVDHASALSKAASSQYVKGLVSNYVQPTSNERRQVQIQQSKDNNIVNSARNQQQQQPQQKHNFKPKNQQPIQQQPLSMLTSEVASVNNKSINNQSLLQVTTTDHQRSDIKHQHSPSYSQYQSPPAFQPLQLSPSKHGGSPDRNYLQSTDSNNQKRRFRVQPESKKLGDIELSQERDAQLAFVVSKYRS